MAPTNGTVVTPACTLTGTGYTAGKTVTTNNGVTFAGAALTINATQTVSASGGWSATFTVPSATNGAKTVVATDSGGANASTSFTVYTDERVNSAVLVVTP